MSEQIKTVTVADEFETYLGYDIQTDLYLFGITTLYSDGTFDVRVDYEDCPF